MYTYSCLAGGYTKTKQAETDETNVTLGFVQRPRHSDWFLVLIMFMYLSTGTMHGRGRMTIDPRTPTFHRRSTLDFHRQCRHCLHQARDAVGSWVSRMKCRLQSTKNRYYRRVFFLEYFFLIICFRANYSSSRFS